MNSNLSSPQKIFSTFHSNHIIVGIVLCSFALILSIIPFFVVHFVPATDLPQHLAQIKLFYTILSSHDSGMYSITFFNANVLVYWVLAVLWLLFPPLITAKVLMVGLIVTWIAAVFLLAWKTQRTYTAALLASTMAFNASFYWGFVNFLIGFPLFVLWYIFVVHPTDKNVSWNISIVACILSILLFLAHALWLAVAWLVLLLIDIRRRVALRSLLFQGIGIAPVVILAAVWFPSLATSRASLHFDTAPHWIVTPFERLQPLWVVNSLYGGLHSPIEWLLLFALLGWSVISLYSNRHQLRDVIQWELLLVSGLLFAIVYLAPEKYVNTIYFASRWYPIAATFFLLALPAPRFSFLLQTTGVGLLFFIFSAVTAFSWQAFERYENSGLREALEKIPDHSRVVGLDFVKESQILCGQPFMQTFAYAQALHGSETNFSFSLHQSGIVRTTATSFPTTWTPGLEWFAEKVRFEDFEHFDYAIVNATDELHAIFELLPTLKPITKNGRWRLYACIHGTGFHGPLFGQVK